MVRHPVVRAGPVRAGKSCFLKMLKFIKIMITLHILYETRLFGAILDSWWWLVVFLKMIKIIKFMNILGKSYEKLVFVSF